VDQAHALLLGDAQGGWEGLQARGELRGGGSEQELRKGNM
jgi:hypothetical protein